jgi:AcrR family transcriptional regulator
MSVSTVTRHAEATRRAILEAGVELLLERRGAGFSVQEVADRAGLTHRTVYRYFPTRQELMAATARLLPGFADDSFGDVSSVEDWIAGLARHHASIEANLGVVRSVLAAVLASDDLLPFGQARQTRDTHRREVFRRQFPHLPESDARRTYAVLRHVTSSASYVLCRLRFGMSPAEATETIRSGASDIVAQAARRDRAAARTGRSNA